MTDTYYDTGDYRLSSRDNWLRCRGDKLELKLTLNEDIEKRSSDQYREITEEAQIAQWLGIAKNGPFEALLLQAGYVPFATIITTRRKYTKKGYSIDLDSMDFGHEIAEIETMIDKESNLEIATIRITEFAHANGITLAAPWGKVVEYLRRNNPEHFQVLLENRVIKKVKRKA